LWSSYHLKRGFVVVVASLLAVDCGVLQVGGLLGICYRRRVQDGVGDVGLFGYFIYLFKI
jgi:hypothetical protein